ncbi:50S ribosomal protein L11 methyltransferase [Rhodovulum sp. BSW8]|uniref:Ribosomal protein L11 methyltransferase n=1 Tax=Rhodovulum visakhapatnamense TaxID=364297 RepID=A0A4R8FP52_9RHOB|nr:MULTISPECIES: 50S ribosomal protein L11 methyltransferase [Rhodovulum]OLS44509.1 ribosomal protein L11 methyltransferase [Rhodovulum sulfidophilum]MBL3571203.1 50S ribosomal protein L11 methyltransferase [Rhodovulum visakhapatnamense]MBL3579182.1 50S ribosomal protein L11 methyltransferase [Rhodovulum visakhapatnamense]RBO53490.1 50S ribosomal protein L11 methyltransferase [Rhodovulum sp. BSW8]TDX28200.1 [LSU ribosomal protein L11P]-lysine N-methyltransferase [Rhodovulum visakhapatnamense]
MPTYSALTTLTAKAAADALAEAIESRMDPEPIGVGVFEIEDGSGLWELGAFFTEAPDEAGLALLAMVHGARPFTVSEVPETDWVAKVRRDLAPVQAGRFFLYGSHDADRVPEGPVPLLIEASMAFGTGHHGTTLGCLRAVDRLAEAGLAPGAVADIGCGTAVLAMAAAHLWQVPILASDIDPVAVEVAEANVAANGLAGRIRCIEAAGFEHPELAAAAPYGLIFANILKAPLIALAPDIAAQLAPGGIAILSGLLNEQAEEVAAAYAASGLELEGAEQIGDWTTLCVLKRRA